MSFSVLSTRLLGQDIVLFKQIANGLVKSYYIFIFNFPKQLKIEQVNLVSVQPLSTSEENSMGEFTYLHFPTLSPLSQIV